ncbi:MAG: 23S rRNA (guanosine(2251)-2'-O)-methyltransferase RlmB [Gammaproteobacteria bacterium]
MTASGPKTDLIFGYHAVSAALAVEPDSIREVWIQSDRGDRRMQRLVTAVEQLGITVQRLSRRSLDQLAAGGCHQGVIVRCGRIPRPSWNSLDALLADCQAAPLLLVLDGVQDPRNLGACLRTADAVGVHAVIVPKHRAASMTPAVRKVACGAAETVPLWQVTNLARTLRELCSTELFVVGASPEASPTLYEVDLTGPVAIVLGSEERGLRRLTREHCDCLVRIPLHGTVTSLNVAVAAAVLLYEVHRQRWLRRQGAGRR